MKNELMLSSFNLEVESKYSNEVSKILDIPVITDSEGNIAQEFVPQALKDTLDIVVNFVSEKDESYKNKFRDICNNLGLEKDFKYILIILKATLKEIQGEQFTVVFDTWESNGVKLTETPLNIISIEDTITLLPSIEDRRICAKQANHFKNIGLNTIKFDKNFN